MASLLRVRPGGDECYYNLAVRGNTVPSQLLLLAIAFLHWLSLLLLFVTSICTRVLVQAQSVLYPPPPLPAPYPCSAPGVATLQCLLFCCIICCLAKPLLLHAVFLSIFKWETRKGWDVLLDAYLSEFTGNDPVELHIMTHSLSDGAQGVSDKSETSDRSDTLQRLQCML